jgi:alpha-2-macroglobulin
MKKILANRIFQIALVLVLIVIISFGIHHKYHPKRKHIEINPEYTEFVAAVTSGFISTESSIKVVLVNPYNGDSSYKEKLLDGLFSFSPGVKGQAHWKDAYTVEFIPSEKLKQSTSYEVSFKLNRIAGISSKLDDFKFSFQTITQNFSITYEQLHTYNSDPSYYYMEGSVITADVDDNQKLENLIEASTGNTKNNIHWRHSSDRLTHNFTIDSIKRSENQQQLEISWDGNSIDVDKKDHASIDVPARSVFKVLGVILHNDSSQYFTIYFSDPLSTSQYLNGLVTLDDIGIKLTREDNTLKVYPNQLIAGQSHELIVSEGIENINSKKLGVLYSKQFGFSDIKPAVELVGKGVIMPNSDSLIMPFKAVNLKAVDVTVTKIYKNNIQQFLQNNDIDNDYNIRLVGRPIIRQRINLQNSGVSNLSRWHLFSLDLAKLIKPDKGALYRVTISFRKAYSIYHCEGQKEENANEEPLTDQVSNIENEDQKYNNEYDEYSYYSDEEGDYDNYWENRDNPCHSAYYNNSDRFKSRNVLASNIGIIGKVTNQNEVTVIVTNITDAQPANNVSIEVFDMQHQSLGKTSTNSQGMATLKCMHQPFIVIAKNGDEFGYLTFKDGQSLSLSMFDVKGQETQKGLKGFIYGERGVWRPGDSLYLTFILEDKDNQFPAGNPVIFELSNPRGQLFKRQVKVQNVNGFYTYETVTPDNAPTGNWLLTVKAGGASFTKTIKIETIKPNRLAIELNLGKDSVFRGDIKGTIGAKWLHGAIASNMKTNINMGLVKTTTSFQKFPDFTFDDQSVSFKAQEQVIYEGSLNSEGKANFSYKLTTEKSAPGMLKLALVTKVFEESGDFSIDYFTTKYSPFTYYAGISLSMAYGYYGWLFTDTTQKIKIATVDYLGRAVSRQNVKVELIKLDWHWWWDQSEEDLASYVNSERNQIVKRVIISTSSDGYGIANFRIPGDQRGSYYIRVIDSDGHQAGKMVYFYNPWYRDYESGQHPEAAAMLIVSPDKEKYAPGERARISFPATKKTRALVSIESGSKIIDIFWSDAIPNKDNRATLEFEVNEKMCPNAFVNITLLQPYLGTGNDMPLRMYGYAPILVENPETHLYPVIKAPEKVGSEEKVKIQVSEKKGRSMTYTVALIDEGLLNITRFRTPNPWDCFYAKEALGVNTWDLYNYIFGSAAGKIEHMFAVGGDIEAFGDKGDKTKNRFAPVVKFLGPFTLNKNSENNHVIQLPKYSGAVRAMVVAGNNGAYGCADKSIIVKNSLMIIATLPRVLGPDEEVLLPVTLFADETEIKDVEVEVKTNQMISVVGESKQQTHIDKPEGKDVYFKLKVKNTIGTAKVKVFATAGSHKADYEIDLIVRNPNEKETRISEMAIEPGKTWSGNIEWFGMEGSNKASLEVSVCPPMDLSRRLEYLLEYPYGCIEQNTSAVFPQLYLNDIMEMTDKDKATAEYNIKSGIERLKLFQTSEGAFTYWPGSNWVNDWGCIYAGQFILEAEKKGYMLPQGMKKSWIQYEGKQARNWPYNDTYTSHLTQAYRLMTLAMAGSPEIGAMNRLKESITLPPQAKWMLASAYAYAGQAETAKDMLKTADANFKIYRETGITFGSQNRDLAMVIPILVYLKDYDKAFPLVEKLAKILSSQEWLSTQETAFSLIAMSRFINSSGKYDGTLSCNYNVNGNSQKLSTSQKLYRWEITEPNKMFMVENTGKGILFGRLSTDGTPVAGNEGEISSNLILSVYYTNMKGEKIDISKLKQGTDFKAIVKITNPPSLLGYYQNMALAQIFPSGWEIINTRLADIENTSDNATKPDYQDIRDDRVYSFFGIPSDGSKTFEVLLNASYAGRFYLPSLHCNAMYDNNIKAQKKGMWVEVEH